MNVKMLSTIRNLEIEKSTNFVFHEHTLTNNESVFEREFNNNFYLEQLGEVDYNDIKNKPFFYLLRNDGILSNRLQKLKLQYDTKTVLSEFIESLWLIKDNSVYIFKQIFFDETAKGMNYLMNGVSYSNCSGNLDQTAFTEDELQEAVIITEKITGISSVRVNLEAKPPDYRKLLEQPLAHCINYNWTNRIERALLFLSMARSYAYLPIKLSLFIPIYESLFSNVDIEISHQVSERVAFYIGGDEETKYKNYRLLKDAYNIRSRFFHGEKLNSHKDLTQQRELSLRIDNLTRSVLRKVILQDSEFFLDEKKLKDWLPTLIFNFQKE
jgi:hypothetical protein